MILKKHKYADLVLSCDAGEEETSGVQIGLEGKGCTLKL